MSNTSRESAQRAARIAAYGSATKRTPADYTLKEALAAMHREYVKTAKGKQATEVDDGVFGPIFEAEATA